MTAIDPVVEDQSTIAAFLGDPATHGGAAVERIDTHISMVFLAGDTVYKVKRAVRFGYLDFSTLQKREAACRAEIALNRRTAPDLYRRVAAIARAPSGALALDGPEDGPDGPGETVEWAVVMRRFEQDGLFDRLAERGALTPAHVRDAVTAAAALHRTAASVFALPAGSTAAGGYPLADGTGGLKSAMIANLDELTGRPELFPPDTLATLRGTSLAALDANAALLEGRRARGYVRRCHGDLHLRNICLIDGRAILFDAIEFSEALASIDVLYDFAFLLMDLEYRGLRALANLALNVWLPLAPGGAPAALEALAALPVMLASRAQVRAKVAASAEAAQPGAAGRAAMRDAARAYFALSQSFLEPLPPRLVTVGGLSGSGKSTLARALAPELGRAPGAVHLRSDTIRKEMFGVVETERLPPAAYTREMSDRVYGEIHARARLALAAGQAVVVDAVSSDAAGRAELRRLAERAGVPFTGIWLDAPADTLKARVTARSGDASDADAAVVAMQLVEETGPIDWRRLDAGGDFGAILAAARDFLAAD